MVATRSEPREGQETVVRDGEFDEIDIDRLRGHGSVKWTTFPDTIGAFVAEMDFGIAPPITEALHDAVETGLFGYLPRNLDRAMADAYAQWAASAYGWQVDPASVRPIADVIDGLTIAIERFSRPGSAIVLPTPAYMPFLTVPRSQNRRIIQVPMVEDGDRLVYDLDALDRAFADGGGLLVLCNPHNPTGRVMRRDELADIAEVVDRHGARVFADEIHAPIVYPGHEHVPYVSVNEAAAGHTVTATSASKAWNLPGMKCAQMILSNDDDRQTWAGDAMMLEHGASNLGVIANTAAYREGRPWLENVADYLDGSRQMLAELVTEHLPGVGYRVPEGTYLAWLDCSRLGLGDDLAAFFAEHAGVSLTDGAACGEAGRGRVRYTFATPRPIMRRTIEQMGAAVTNHRP